MKDNPKVSIITVVYNGEEFLEETILSVLNQSYENIEYVIIDGGSTDGTVDIIKKYEDKIDYWVSEPDKGIYNAMNKGLQVVNGDYIAILNADDYYVENAIESNIKILRESDCDYTIANVQFINGTIIKPIIPLKTRVYQEMPYPHVSALIANYIYNDVGLFDEDFKIAGDHDMAVRIISKGYKSCYNNTIVAFLEDGGISDGYKSNYESCRVAIKNGKSIYNAYFIYLKQIFKLFLAKNLPLSVVKYLQRIKGSRFE